MSLSINFEIRLLVKRALEGIFSFLIRVHRCASVVKAFLYCTVTAKRYCRPLLPLNRKRLLDPIAAIRT